MKIITDFCIYRSWADEEKKHNADALVSTIRTFAGMAKTAFWDSNSKTYKGNNCVVVFGFDGTPESAAYIKTDDIEREVKDWCDQLKDWCDDDADTDLEDERYAHKEVRVEIEDLLDGGFRIASFNKDDEREHELAVLPLHEKEGDSK